MRQRSNASVISEKIEINFQSAVEGDGRKSLTSDAKWRKTFYLCLAVRILNSLLVHTYFNPDEHWQSLEVAHRLVFGYGHLTWEWKRGIRGYLHPLLFSLLYKVLAFLHLDTPWFMMRGPRLFQSCFAAVGDLYIYKFSDAVFGNHVAQWTFLSGWALVIAITSLIDRIMYGSWIIVPFNFLTFNLLSSGGDYYGTHPWHWYFTQGFPVMLFTFLPFTVAGIIFSKHWKLSGLIGWVIGIYSILGHKEFRFVLPALPVALMFSGYSLADINTPDTSFGKSKRTVATRWPSKLQFAVLFLLVTNIPMGLYMSLVHQRGPEDVMHYLAKEAQNGEVRSVLFLTPCHATPYYSALHQDLLMRFLDCTPSEQRGIPDESDRFMLDPLDFMSEFARNWSLPSHIVLFDSEERKLKDFLISQSFREVKRFFHSHFKVDRDLQSSIVVYAYSGW